MPDQQLKIHQNIYQNAVTGATSNPVISKPDAIDEEFAEAANRVLSNAGRCWMKEGLRRGETW